MATSCFFCQSLLSDYLEGILPSARHDELTRHLTSCSSCEAVRDQLQRTIKTLGTAPAITPTHELSMRIVEAAQSTRRRWTARQVSQTAFFVVLPLLLFGAIAVNFPRVFPWIAIPVQKERDEEFVRYSPLSQGATEIVEDQASWLQTNTMVARSVWEEGGLSAEDFEKTFELKPSRELSGKKSHEDEKGSP